MPFGLESSAFRLKVTVEIDELVLGLESRTLQLALWLESSALRVRFRLMVTVMFRVRVGIEGI